MARRWVVTDNRGITDLTRFFTSSITSIASGKGITFRVEWANYRVRSSTSSTNTSIVLSTRIVVIAVSTIRIFRISAVSSNWVTSTNIVAIVHCRTDYWRRAYTYSIHTSINLCAQVIIITRRTIRFLSVDASSIGRITERIFPTFIGRRASYLNTSANTAITSAVAGTSIAVITSDTIRLGRVCADSSSAITSTNIVAFILSRTDDRFSITESIVTCVIGSAKSFVGASFAINRDWIRARSRGRITNTYFMALIRSRANNWRTDAKSILKIELIR